MLSTQVYKTTLPQHAYTMEAVRQQRQSRCDSDDLSGNNTTLTCTRAAWISVNFWSNMDGPGHSLQNAFQCMQPRQNLILEHVVQLLSISYATLQVSLNSHNASDHTRDTSFPSRNGPPLCCSCLLSLSSCC